MRKTFLIKDYYQKRTGHQYDVVFEDTGPDTLNILEPTTVFALVKDAELVNNPCINL